MRKSRKSAREHHLMVDFHGAYKPTGLRRTYPNLITREGVMGAEYNKFHQTCDAFAQRHPALYADAGGSHGLHAGGFRNVTAEQFKPDRIDTQW